MQRLIKFLRWLAVFTIVMLFAGWLVLESALFVDVRRSFVGDVLTKQIGQPVIINDDVRFRLTRFGKVFIGGVVIPSENMENVNLAELDVGSFEFDIWRLLRGDVDIDNLEVIGLHVYLLTDADGTNSWTENAATPAKTGEGESPGLFDFLTERTVNFSDISLKMDSEVSGFEFDFLLEDFNVDQLANGDVVTAKSRGTINGQSFAVDSTFPKDDTFKTAATFGAVQMNVDGQVRRDSIVTDYDAVLSVDIGSIGDTLDVLKLDGEIEGTLTLTADLSRIRGIIGINNLETNMTLDSGQSFTATGSIENLFTMAGLDVFINALFQPPDATIKTATNLKELRITEINTHLLSSELGGVENKNLIVKTNYFDQEFNTVGPISIGQIKRNEDGELSLNDIDIQIGPKEVPFVKSEGNIRNLLQFSGVEFEGKLAASAGLVLTTLDPDQAEAFGSVRADFGISDASGDLGLTHMKMRTEGSDLWSLSADLSVANMVKFGDMALRLDLGVADGARFLSALNLEPVDTGKVGLSVGFTGSGTDVSADAIVTVGGSQIDITLSNTGGDGGALLRGGLVSERIDIKDLSNVVASGVQLASMKAGGKGGAGNDARDVKPLVLKSEIKPLVIEKDVKLVDPGRMLRELDLEFGIHVQELLGQSGISGINSELEIRQGILQLGPLEAHYGGGYFNVNATMDLVEAPDVMNISGTTNGWDIGEILDAIGLGIKAHGKIEGRFNLTGNITSARSFLNTVYGSATVYMTNGNIATSLLELSGLGIFPWLFSKELQQGYTEIVCAVAPVRIEPGRVFSDSIVVETRSVQLVVQGIADWKNDTISVRAEPRPVGRPLARSAWPFVVTGKLSEPEFKLLVGGVATKKPANADKKADPATPRKPCIVD